MSKSDSHSSHILLNQEWFPCLSRASHIFSTAFAIFYFFYAGIFIQGYTTRGSHEWYFFVINPLDLRRPPCGLTIVVMNDSLWFGIFDTSIWRCIVHRKRLTERHSTIPGPTHKRNLCVVVTIIVQVVTRVVKVIQVSRISIQIWNTVLVYPVHLWRPAMVKNIIVTKMRVKLKHWRPVGVGIASVKTVVHHLIRRGMVVNHRVWKAMHRLRMSVRNAMSIEGYIWSITAFVVVVQILKDFFTSFFGLWIVVTHCFASLWGILLSCYRGVAWGDTHRRFKEMGRHDIIGSHRRTILVQQAVQRQNMKLFFVWRNCLWLQKRAHLQQ